jgi:hypothetical protein
VFRTLPSQAILNAAFPQDQWNNPSAWRSTPCPFLQNFYNKDFLVDVHANYSAWFGDNWRTTENLTVNMGIRYDITGQASIHPASRRTDSKQRHRQRRLRLQNQHARQARLRPARRLYLQRRGKNDLVIGGSGMFFNFPVSNVTYRQQFYNNSITAAFFPTNKCFDGQPTCGATLEQIMSGAIPTPPQQTTIIA